MLKHKIDLQPPQVKKWNGFIYKLILQTGKAVIYEQRNQDGFIVGYEVHKLRVRKQRTINGITVKSCIQFPSDPSFGIWAWSYYTVDRAINTLIKIQKGEL